MVLRSSGRGNVRPLVKSTIWGDTCEIAMPGWRGIGACIFWDSIGPKYCSPIEWNSALLKEPMMMLLKRWRGWKAVGKIGAEYRIANLMPWTNWSTCHVQINCGWIARNSAHFESCFLNWFRQRFDLRWVCWPSMLYNRKTEQPGMRVWVRYNF